MSEAKHTPGPWHIMPRGQVGCDSFPICEVYDADPRNDNPEQEANARLIAASPDLLAACKRLIDCLGPDGYHSTAGKPACDAARAAIARATT